MLALVYQGQMDVRAQEAPEPGPRPGHALLRPTLCGICGTDTGIYLGTHPRAAAPLILGHEFFGTVTASERLAPGTRAAVYPLLSCGNCLACRTGNEHVCNSLRLLGIDAPGGLAGLVAAPEASLYEIPDATSDAAAALIEPLAVVIHAVRRSGWRPCDSAVVLGAGPIGVVTGILLRHLGADEVIVTDLSDKRLERAAAFGLTGVNPAREEVPERVRASTDGEGADVVFECSGAEQSILEATAAARVLGTVCVTAVHKTPHKVDLQALDFKEQLLVGSRVYTREDFAKAVTLSSRLDAQLKACVTDVVPLTQAAKVFDMIADPGQGTVKVAVDCTDGR